MQRFLTLNIIIRKYTIEINRKDYLLADETLLHDATRVKDVSNAIRSVFPGAQLTWALSWHALQDRSSRYGEIRELLWHFHKQYGDVITFIPGGYFANVYNTREQINADITEALQQIEHIFHGYRPESLVCGFLSAENIRHAREKEGITSIQGNIWSQYGIDAQDADGSIAYPYYPSTEHFCKPAQGKDDFIDCLNFDGWTVDLVSARTAGDYWRDGVRFCSRMGVGPLETLHTYDLSTGLREMQQTTEAHFQRKSVQKNPFGWVTNTYEISEATGHPEKRHLNGFSQWLAWIKNTWPDVQCVPVEELGRFIRSKYPDNEGLRYTLSQRGTGIGSSYANQIVTWYMNSRFRIGVVWTDRGKNVFDFTDYTLHYQEPKNIGARDWTLYGLINQKQTRPQDRPCSYEDFPRQDILHEVGEL